MLEHERRFERAIESLHEGGMELHRLDRSATRVEEVHVIRQRRMAEDRRPRRKYILGLDTDAQRAEGDRREWIRQATFVELSVCVDRQRVEEGKEMRNH